MASFKCALPVVFLFVVIQGSAAFAPSIRYEQPYQAPLPPRPTPPPPTLPPITCTWMNGPYSYPEPVGRSYSQYNPAGNPYYGGSFSYLSDGPLVSGLQDGPAAARPPPPPLSFIEQPSPVYSKSNILNYLINKLDTFK